MRLFDHFSKAQQDKVRGFGPVFDVTNVAEYYYSHDKEFWKIGEDFPGCRAPFDRLWVEYRFPSKSRSEEVGEVETKIYREGVVPYVGCFVGRGTSFRPTDSVDSASNPGLSLLTDPGFQHDPGEWGAWAGLWCVDGRGKVVSYKFLVELRFDMDQQGNLTNFYHRDSQKKSPQDLAQECYPLHAVFLAFSLANCKNIEVVDVRAPRKLNKARERRGKLPLVDYRVINVLPFGKTFRRSERTLEAGEVAQVAAHIRRGSFASYGEAYGRKKLFGKYEGRFWRPQSAVGVGAKPGDYRVDP